MCMERMNMKKNKEYPPIPAEWLVEHGTRMIIGPKRIYDSASMALVFALISEWEEECDNDGKADK